MHTRGSSGDSMLKAGRNKSVGIAVACNTPCGALWLAGAAAYCLGQQQPPSLSNAKLGFCSEQQQASVLSILATPL